VLLRGERRPRVALVGRMLTGKSSIFRAASSAAPQQERLLRDGDRYDECVVKLGLEEISLVDLPAVESLCSLSPHDSVVVKYLLWGDRWPPIAAHEAAQPGAAFNAPDVLIQVVDATAFSLCMDNRLPMIVFGSSARKARSAQVSPSRVSSPSGPRMTRRATRPSTLTSTEG